MTEHEQLRQNLEYLKLNEIINHLNETVDFVTRNNLSFEQGLIKLTNCICQSKSDPQIILKLSHFIFK